jgi:hypothetical protein
MKVGQKLNRGISYTVGHEAEPHASSKRQNLKQNDVGRAGGRTSIKVVLVGQEEEPQAMLLGQEEEPQARCC